MADPNEIRALEESFWARFIARYPEFAQKYGTATPRDPNGRFSSKVAQEARTRLSEPVDPTASRPIERRRFRADPHEMVVPIRPEDVEDPTYFTGDYWKDIGGRIGEGIRTLPYIGSDPGQAERIEQVRQTLPEDASWFKKFGLTTLARVQPQLDALQAVQDIAAPATGYVVGQYMQEPGIKDRMDILEERGGAPGVLGDIERLASAYQQAVDAGEIPLKKQIPAEIGTDPVEAFPGGWGIGVAKKALGLGAKPLIRGTATTGRAAGRTAAQVAEEVAETPPAPRATPAYTTAQEAIMGSAAHPISGTYRGTYRQDPSAQLIRRHEAEEVSRRLEEGVPVEYRSGNLIADHIAKQDEIARQAESINTYGGDPSKYVPSDMGVYPEFAEELYLVDAGLDPFKFMGTQGAFHHTSYHELARNQAIDAGWVPGNPSADNMAIANRFADEADALAKTDPEGWLVREAREVDFKANRIPQKYFDDPQATAVPSDVGRQASFIDDQLTFPEMGMRVNEIVDVKGNIIPGARPGVLPDIPPSTAQSRIDEVVENITDTYDPAGRGRVPKKGTSPNKTLMGKQAAQRMVREKFDELTIGNIDPVRARVVARYISQHTGLDTSEVNRLASEARSEETFASEAVTTYGQRTSFNPEIEDQIDILIGMRQEQKHVQRGYKSHYGKIRNEVAASTNMNAGQLEAYIDELSQGALLPMDELPTQLIITENWAKNLSPEELAQAADRGEIYGLNAVQIELPMGRINSRPRAQEEALAIRKNEGYPIPADRPTPRATPSYVTGQGAVRGRTPTSTLERLSPEGKPSDISLKNLMRTDPVAARTLAADPSAGAPFRRDPSVVTPTSRTQADINQARRVLPDSQEEIVKARSLKERLVSQVGNIDAIIREIMPADILGKSFDREWFNKTIGKQLVIRYEALVNQHMNGLTQFGINGTRKLERLGIGEREAGRAFGPERQLVPTASDIGTADNPGPLDILFRALHNEGDWLDVWRTGRGVNHPAMSLDNANLRMEVYEELRTVTDIEQAMRIDFDPEMGTVQDYFYRGWKPPSITEMDAKPLQTKDIAGTPSYDKPRSAMTYVEGRQLGMEPLQWNPYFQSIYSQRQGLQYRMQTELIQHLQSEYAGLAKYVENPEEIMENPGWRVPKVGPAFEGKPFKITGEEAADDVQALVGDRAGQVRKAELGEEGLPVKDIAFKKGQWIVPNNVADTLESLFHSGPKWKYEVVLFGKTRDIAKWVDYAVFIPKRLKLLGSLFQMTDFLRRNGVGATHGIIDAIWIGIERGMTPSQAFEAARQSASSVTSFKTDDIGGWWNIMYSYGAAGKSDVFRQLMESPEAIIPNTDITWPSLVGHGLNITDDTILPAEDFTRILNEVASSANLPTKVGRFFKELEYSSRRGLFNRVYPAAIMTDVKFNLIPIARRAYPNATDNQIMALVARQANIKYSTLMRSQSEIPIKVRDILMRVAFSVNENEGLMRQMIRAVKGEETKFWRQYWLSAGVFFALTATLIHGATTLVTEGRVEGLPKSRFVPFYRKEDGIPIGYNNRFLSPDLPLITRSGEKATIDMLGQLDTAGRMLEPFQFINSRRGTTVSAFWHLGVGKDFYDRETDQWGHFGRALQFVNDIAVPIGFGTSALALTQQAVGDTPLPEVSVRGQDIIREGATLGDVLPVSEQALGVPGLVAQASGENLKAPSRRELEKKMINNALPDSTKESLRELDLDDLRKVENDPMNSPFMDEILLRTEEGAGRDSPSGIFADYVLERNALKDQRLEEESYLENKYSTVNNPIWEPTSFRKDLSNLNIKYRAKNDEINQRYRRMPDVEDIFKPWEGLSDAEIADKRLETPLRWAQYRYFKIMDNHKDKFGNIDWDAFNKDFKEEQDSWGEELVARYEVEQRDKKHEDHLGRSTVIAYYDAMDALSKPEGESWFDGGGINKMASELSKRIGPNARGNTLALEWQRWLDAGQNEKTSIENTSFYRNTIKLLKRERSKNRHTMRLNNPAIDQYVIRWFNSQPVHPSNVQYAINLYPGRPIKLTRPSGQSIDVDVSRVLPR